MDLDRFSAFTREEYVPLSIEVENIFVPPYFPLGICWDICVLTLLVSSFTHSTSSSELFSETDQFVFDQIFPNLFYLGFESHHSNS